MSYHQLYKENLLSSNSKKNLPPPPFLKEGRAFCCCLSVGCSVGSPTVSVHFLAEVAHSEMKFSIQTCYMYKNI